MLSRHKNTILGIDVVKVNKVRFLISYSREFKFATSTELENAKIPTIVQILDIIKVIYFARGFAVMAIAADNTFESMRNDVNFIKLAIILNIYSEDEYEPYIERFNRTLK